MLSILFFFFQAEDGIRDYKVTGVQTCALPISVQPVLLALFLVDLRLLAPLADPGGNIDGGAFHRDVIEKRLAAEMTLESRSGERRVGEEGRYRGGPDHLKKKKKRKKR